MRLGCLVWILMILIFFTPKGTIPMILLFGLGGGFIIGFGQQPGDSNSKVAGIAIGIILVIIGIIVGFNLG